MVRAIGFDAGEERRTYAHVVKAIGLDAGEEHRLTWARQPEAEEKTRESREAWLDRVTGREKRERVDVVGVACKWTGTSALARTIRPRLSGDVAGRAGAPTDASLTRCG